MEKVLIHFYLFGINFLKFRWCATATRVGLIEGENKVFMTENFLARIKTVFRIDDCCPIFKKFQAFSSTEMGAIFMELFSKDSPFCKPNRNVWRKS